MFDRTGSVTNAAHNTLRPFKINVLVISGEGSVGDGHVVCLAIALPHPVDLSPGREQRRVVEAALEGDILALPHVSYLLPCVGPSRTQSWKNKGGSLVGFIRN